MDLILAALDYRILLIVALFNMTAYLWRARCLPLRPEPIQGLYGLAAGFLALGGFYIVLLLYGTHADGLLIGKVASRIAIGSLLFLAGLSNLRVVYDYLRGK